MITKNIVALLLSATVLFSCQSRETSNNTESVPAKTTTPAADAHNSRNSLDWAGTYSGTMPCASCPGIKTKITLNNDDSYQKTVEYLESNDKPETTNGTFTWSADGSKITLEEFQFLVGENQLISLDAEGKQITGELAEHYILKKQ